MAFPGSGDRLPRRPVPVSQPPSYGNGNSGAGHGGYQADDYAATAGYPATGEYLAVGENLAPADPWDRPAGLAPSAGWDAPAAGRDEVTGPWQRPPDPWEHPAGPPPAHWDQPPRSRSRNSRLLPWAAAVAIIALAGSAAAFRLVRTSPGGATAGSRMRADRHAATAASPGLVTYHLVAARRAGGYPFNASQSSAVAALPAAAGGQSSFASCLRTHGLDSTGQVASTVYASYGASPASPGLDVVGFNGTFSAAAAHQLWLASLACGEETRGSDVLAAPGPHGGTLYTAGYTDARTKTTGTTCLWATGSTAAIAWFYDAAAAMKVTDPAAACRTLRSSLEAS